MPNQFQGNPFLTGGGPGTGGVPVPTPLFTGGGYAPTLIRMAREYSKAATENVQQELGARGLGTSTFNQALTERAFRGGFDRASREFQSQQQIYNQWAQGLFQLKAAEAGAPREETWWEKALGYAIPIAGIAASFATGSPAGAVAATAAR